MDLGNLDYYKIFYYTVKNHSISGAAKELQITQPTATRSLQKLEESLGCSLLIRNARGIELSEEGRILQEELAPAFEHLEKAQQRIFDLHNLDNGVIRLGVDSLISQIMVSKTIDRFEQAYPRIHIFISKMYLPGILDYLDKGMIDFAVLTTIHAPFNGSELFKEEIASDLFNRYQLDTLTDDFIVGPKYEYLSDRFIDIERLSKLPFIYPTIEVQGSNYYTSFFQKLHHDRNLDLPVSGAQSRLALVRLNHGFTYFPSRFLDQDYKDKLLYPVFTNIRMRQYDLQMLSAKRTLSSAAGEFLKVILEDFQ